MFLGCDPVRTLPGSVPRQTHYVRACARSRHHAYDADRNIGSMRSGMVPILETERLTLRAWRQADLEPFAQYYANPATAAFVGGTCSRNAAWHRMAAFAGHWSLRGYGFWALEEKSTGQFVGYSGLSY